MDIKVSKKGFQIGDMLPLGITLVVLGIALSLGLTVLADFQTDMTGDAQEGVNDSITGLKKFTSYLPTIALVVVVSVVIGIVVKYLAGNR